MFSVFPKRWWQHGTDHTQHELMTNLCLRVAIPEKFRDNATLYLTYIVQDGETVSDVAERLYDDPSLYWTIYVTNQMLDPTKDWPMGTHELHEHMVKTYGYEKLGDIHHYEDFNGNAITPEAMMYHMNYTNVSVSQAVEHFSLKPISNEQYVTAMNEKKRKIKLIDPDYIHSFTSELERLLNE